MNIKTGDVTASAEAINLCAKVQAHLRLTEKNAGAVYLGEWLSQLALEELECIQQQLSRVLFEQVTEAERVDAENAAKLLSSAETGLPQGNWTQGMVERRLTAWFEAGALEKLIRAELLVVRGAPLSITPARRRLSQLQLSDKAFDRVL